MNRKKIVAVDFDGTLSLANWPGCGNPNAALISALKKMQGKVILILWTCRGEERLKEALEWLEGFDLHFDYANENCKEALDQYGYDCRKILADIYIDDKAVRPEHLEELNEYL